MAPILHTCCFLFGLKKQVEDCGTCCAPVLCKDEKSYFPFRRPTIGYGSALRKKFLPTKKSEYAFLSPELHAGSLGKYMT